MWIVKLEWHNIWREVWLGRLQPWLKPRLRSEEELNPLLVLEWLGASVAVGLMRVLGALLGWRRVSHGALRLSGTLDIALVTKAGARVLKERKKKRWRENTLVSSPVILLKYCHWRYKIWLYVWRADKCAVCSAGTISLHLSLKLFISYPLTKLLISDPWLLQSACRSVPWARYRTPYGSWWLHHWHLNVCVYEFLMALCALFEKFTLFIQNPNVRQENRCLFLPFASSRSLNTRPACAVLHVQWK